MAKYKAYPEYKDSGVEWLGEIPAHWRINKLRYLFTFGKGLTITKENLQDEGISCINYGEIHSKYGFEISPQINLLKCVDKKYLKDNSDSLLLKGDIIFADTSEDVDGSGNFSQLISDDIVFAGYHTIIAKPSNRKNWRFYAYLLDSKELRSQVRHAVKGVKVFSITQAILRGLTVWLPTDDEQEKIAGFLDHETAKIDNLIEKQQQLIELLKEKRQAVISYAVTKGLNPYVPMKDSGVEWLGSIPRTWNCVAIKNICKIVNGSTPKSSIEEYWDGDIDWFTPTDLSQKENIKINESLRKITNSGFLSCGTTMVPADTVILSSRAPIGSLAITLKTACTNQGCKSLVTFNASLSKYIYYSLLTFNSPLNNLGRGSTFLELSTDDLGGFKISLPDDDMSEILRYIDKITSKIDNLIKAQLLQIALLQERRTALISAAVTGKIDVRHWHAPNEHSQTTVEAEVAV